MNNITSYKITFKRVRPIAEEPREVKRANIPASSEEFTPPIASQTIRLNEDIIKGSATAEDYAKYFNKKKSFRHLTPHIPNMRKIDTLCAGLLLHPLDRKASILVKIIRGISEKDKCCPVIMDLLFAFLNDESFPVILKKLRTYNIFQEFVEENNPIIFDNGEVERKFTVFFLRAMKEKSFLLFIMYRYEDHCRFPPFLVKPLLAHGSEVLVDRLFSQWTLDQLKNVAHFFSYNHFVDYLSLSVNSSKRFHIEDNLLLSVQDPILKEKCLWISLLYPESKYSHFVALPDNELLSVITDVAQHSDQRSHPFFQECLEAAAENAFLQEESKMARLLVHLMNIGQIHFLQNEYEQLDERSPHYRHAFLTLFNKYF